MAEFHRVVVAHGAANRCRKELGGSGSLMIDSELRGKMHYESRAEGGMPFAVGQVDPNKGYIHVFDDTTLDIVITTLDTITDFVSYLSKKEKLLQREYPKVFAAGEEELLAFYLRQLNRRKEHDFVIPSKNDFVVMDEGLWDEFMASPQRKAQFLADEISYSWDALIETFSKHAIQDTQYYSTHPGIYNIEKIVRFLAREPRTRRRMLAEALIGLIENTPKTFRGTRVVFPSEEGDPHYVFLVLPHFQTRPYEEYRKVRGNLLEILCRVAKAQFPEAVDIIGIATETDIDTNRSEDILYLDARSWTYEDQEEAKNLQKELGLLRKITKHQEKVFEYPIPPVLPTHKTSKPLQKIPRNSPCPCGSGKKYKHCCLKKTKN